MTEVIIDYETLTGKNNEPVVKELSIAADGVLQTWHFRSPYTMLPHGSEENGLNWADGHLDYHDVFTVLSEGVAIYPHLYARGIIKCAFLSALLQRPILNLEDFGCPSHEDLVSTYHCYLPCHKFKNVLCATANAHVYHDWLLYHFKTRSYVKCPEANSRHTAGFLSAIV